MPKTPAERQRDYRQRKGEALCEKERERAKKKDNIFYEEASVVRSISAPTAAAMPRHYTFIDFS
ncbi:MAG: hypothetical protein V2I33_17080 [Kangiellaceae bacterium]|jgi:hypothetical protein|nr:hypothetical protein [Kangiellaceae bacterium]